jgi:hypothetical protein
MRLIAATLIGGAAACLLGAGCQSSSDAPPSYVSGLRVLAIKAEPPDIAPGASATVTVLAIDTGGATPTAAWSRCMRAPLAGQAVNPDCVTGAAGTDLVPVGNGLAVTVPMPNVTAASLGAPDSSGGVYLPLIAHVSTPGDEITASYRLRFASGDPAGQPANTNPSIASVFVAGASGQQTPLDENTPLVVHAGDKITLGATFAPGSAESYTSALPNASGGTTTTTTTETLDVAWFSTAGSFDNDKTSDVQPQTVLSLSGQLPAAGTIIDLYAVGRDERGGTDWVHRTLRFE